MDDNHFDYLAGNPVTTIDGNPCRDVRLDDPRWGLCVVCLYPRHHFAGV
jgi:hypothetical protein